MRTRRQTNAGPSALPGVRPRSNQSGEDTRPRCVVPQLEDLVAQLSARQLEAVRAQVQPGERVALYQQGASIRVLLVGQQRLHQVAPAVLDRSWRRLAVVAVEEDGERALPVVWS